MTVQGRNAPKARVPARYLIVASLVVLFVAMGLSTTYVDADAPVPGAEEAFEPAAFGKEQYASTVKPAIEESPVDLVELLPLLAEDPDAAGAKYGKREGTSPYTYSVTVTGIAEKAVNGLMPIKVDGIDPEARITVQIGPAINGTALRDATGLISFNDFVNQVQYAQAATALNNEMKADLFQGLETSTMVGKPVTVVGAAAPLNPQLITITPVSIAEAS